MNRGRGFRSGSLSSLASIIATEFRSMPNSHPRSACVSAGNFSFSLLFTSLRNAATEWGVRSTLSCSMTDLSLISRYVFSCCGGSGGKVSSVAGWGWK